MADWSPDLEDVGALVRVRTKPIDGQTATGTFTSNTRPTDQQVEQLIIQAVGYVEAAIGTLAEDLYDRAEHVAAIYAAMLVELSYFPEQVNTDQSPYEKLKELFDGAMSGLLGAVLGNSPRKGVYSVPMRSPVLADADVIP